jgi:hypothetical protein
MKKQIILKRTKKWGGGAISAPHKSGRLIPQNEFINYNGNIIIWLYSPIRALASPIGVS